jgi:4-diphosphocytidyl-2-C-methyl-D-erythritol kinase
MRRAVEAGDIEEIGRRLHNRLEGAARRLRPEIEAGLALLRQQGPAGVLMSGSGTSLFALCRDPGEARRIARALTPTPGAVAGGDLQVSVVRSCS